VPRQKIRIRSYNNKNKYYLEKKINSEEGKFKKTKIISETEYEKNLNIGILIPRLGICNPKVIVSYNRSYYSFDNFRITIDRDINFIKFNSTKKFQLTKNILEIKTNIDNHQNIKKKFPWRHYRFSKYCEGIMALNIR
jgi:adenylate cyclase class IV